MTAILIHPDGTLADVDLPQGKAPKVLGAICAAIGRPQVDFVDLGRTVEMWLDGENTPSHPVNPVATELAHTFGHTDRYFGPVLFTGLTDNGDTVNLTGQQAHALRDLASYLPRT